MSKLTDVKYANLAAALGHLDLLMILEEEYGILPDVEGANMAAGAGNLRVLRWLEAQGVDPDQRGAANAVFSGQIKVLEWFEKKGLLPLSPLQVPYGHPRINKETFDWLTRIQIEVDII